MEQSAGLWIGLGIEALVMIVGLVSTFRVSSVASGRAAERMDNLVRKQEADQITDAKSLADAKAAMELCVSSKVELVQKDIQTLTADLQRNFTQHDAFYETEKQAREMARDMLAMKDTIAAIDTNVRLLVGRAMQEGK
jgi:hypothetical protein